MFLIKKKMSVRLSALPCASNTALGLCFFFFGPLMLAVFLCLRNEKSGKSATLAL